MSWLAAEYRRFDDHHDDIADSGLDKVHLALQGKIKRLTMPRKLKYWRAVAKAALEEAKTYQGMPDAMLQSKIEHLRAQALLGNQSTHLQEALAVLVEVADRTLNQRPYEVQLMAVCGLSQSCILQMAPGEGKTLTAGLAGVLAAWLGKPCHITTSNDYLAGRDAVLMSPLFSFCDITVGAIHSGLSPDERAVTYQYDVVYATSKELLADYLKDMLSLQGEQCPDQQLLKTLTHMSSHSVMMRGLHTVIVDEADSILADEAITPLIISAPGENHLLKEASNIAHHAVKELDIGRDYIVNEHTHQVDLTEQGEQTLQIFVSNLPRLWQNEGRYMQLIRQAILAKTLYKRDQHYVVKDDQVVIVDESTGRLMEGKTWSFGLHQAIEAKEGLTLSDPNETYAKMSFQRFFRLYHRVSGMSGTTQGLEGELWRIYRLPVATIPPRKRNQRTMLPSVLCQSKAQKWQRISEEVATLSLSTRPILIGTRSIEESEILRDYLVQQGISVQLLHALKADDEANIIAAAGLKGTVTVATNMAGRGTDIALSPELLKLGGLHVIATELAESRRVDHQLFGRSARQGYPGSAQQLFSLEDHLFKHYATPIDKRIIRFFLKINLAKFAINYCSTIQSRAEKKGSLMRKNLLEQDFIIRDKLSFSRSQIVSQ